MRKNNKTCICCGEEYTFCFHCRSKNAPAWMNNFHSENCKKIFKITSEYLTGKITADEAKKAYSECDLSYKKKLKPKIVETINEVNRKTRKKKKEVIKEETSISEINNEVFE